MLISSAVIKDEHSCKGQERTCLHYGTYAVSVYYNNVTV